MENNEEQQATMDFEAIHERQNEELTELLDRRDMKRLQQRLEDMQEFDVAEFLSEIGDNRMPMVFRLLSKETAAEVFANFDAPEQEQVINSITDSELSGILEELYVDDAVDMMEELPANVVKRVMRTATPETRKLINQYLHYPENSAGSIMTAEFIDLKKYMNVKESIARIRRIGEDKETIYVCFVTSADRKLEGIVTVKDLLLAEDDTVIENLMDTNVIFASTTEDQESVSEKFSDYDLMALPVVDNLEGRPRRHRHRRRRHRRHGAGDDRGLRDHGRYDAVRQAVFEVGHYRDVEKPHPVADVPHALGNVYKHDTHKV